MMINRWLGTESDCFDWTNGRSGDRPFLGPSCVTGFPGFCNAPQSGLTAYGTQIACTFPSLFVPFFFMFDILVSRAA